MDEEKEICVEFSIIIRAEKRYINDSIRSTLDKIAKDQKECAAYKVEKRTVCVDTDSISLL